MYIYLYYIYIVLYLTNVGTNYYLKTIVHVHTKLTAVISLKV